jgi:nitrogen regulatory protein P-II 2
MKLVVAVIKPFKLDEVRDAIEQVGASGLTVSEVMGFGPGQNYFGAERELSFVPKLKIEVAVRDDMVDAAVDAIQKHAVTGKIGDGKIFIYEMSDVVRIRTGERGHDAL